MMKKSGRKFIFLGVFSLFLCAMTAYPAIAETKVYFNKPVDKRFAWLNNDASGNINFQSAIVALISSATKSIDVCTMSFGGVDSISDALAAAANAEKKVRIVGDSGNRWKSGFQRTLRGPVQIVDNNLPALVCRINFQKQDSQKPPEGFFVDYGEEYGDRGNGYFYGWTAESKNKFSIKTTSSTEYTSPLLKDIVAVKNSETAEWKIRLSSGSYYVLINMGADEMTEGLTYRTDKKKDGSLYEVSYNYIKANDNYVFRKNYSYEKTEKGAFTCSTVDGSGESENSGQKISVENTENGKGLLKITLGANDSSAKDYTLLNFIEIYRAAPDGKDPKDNKQYVQERQIQHSKFILIDADTPQAKLWTGSGNLTASNLSEDAIVTDEPEICKAFYEEFNQMWGGQQLDPNPNNAAFGTFKRAISLKKFFVKNSSVLPGESFAWQVHFSPSKSANSLNLYSDLSDFIGNAKSNLIVLLEQWTSGGDIKDKARGTLLGSTHLMQSDLGNYIKQGNGFYGVFGNSDSDSMIFNEFKKYGNAKIEQNKDIHHKFALADAYRDTRYAKKGSLLFGSMNWSNNGMHFNDEQTLIINDPALANQYLQRAMAALNENGILPPSDTDIVLVLDRSYSMTSKCTGTQTSKLDAMKSASKLFVDLLATDEKHRISIVRFGNGVEPNQNPSTAKLEPLTQARATEIKKEIDSISADGNFGNWTCYGTALQAALDNFNAVSKPSRRIVVFFSDGMENKAPKASEIYPKLVDENIEIHSIAFGTFSPFASDSKTAILAEMATDSAGSFAQMDTDETLLKKRFAEIAGDILQASVILNPEHNLTDKSLKVNFSVPEIVDSFKVIQLNELSSSVPKMKALEPSTSKRKRIAVSEAQSQDTGYKVSDFKMNSSKIKKNLLTMELKPEKKVSKGYSAKLNLMVLAKAPTTIKSEVIADKPGQKNITLLCRMLQDNQALTDADITAEWTTPVSYSATKTSTIKLYDDGKHGDGEAGDGLFGAKLTLNEEGNHSFHFIGISKKDNRLTAIKRTIKSEKKKARLTPSVRRETTVYYTVNK